MRHLMLFLAAAAAAAVAGPAWAEASGEAVARGLQAQFQGALIRERRLADDRETRLIADYESQLRAARARYDAGAAGALAELERARAQYGDLVSQIAQRDAASRAEIEAYRAEAQGLAQRATPELLEAYQRFADGDRVGAWPVIDALTQAQVRATMAAAGARAAIPVRDAAQARETMRLYGEATVADVLALWDQAASLDPRDFDTHLARARLAQSLNDLSRADAAIAAMQSAATTDGERRLAAEEAGNLAFARNNLAEAERQFQFALATTRRLAGNDPRYLREISVYLNRVGDVLRARNDLAGALEHYREGLTIARALYAQDRSNAERARDVGVSLDRVGDVLVARNDLAGALEHYREGLTKRRALHAQDRSNAERARDVWASLWRIAEHGGGRWADVVAAMEEARGLGLFNETTDGSFLTQARANAAAEAGR